MDVAARIPGETIITRGKEGAEYGARERGRMSTHQKGFLGVLEVSAG